MVRLRSLTAVPLIALLGACAGTTGGDAVAGPAVDRTVAVTVPSTAPTPPSPDTNDTDTDTDTDTDSSRDTDDSESTDDSDSTDEPDGSGLTSKDYEDLGKIVTGQEQELLWKLPKDLPGWKDLEVAEAGYLQYQLEGTACLVTLSQPFDEALPTETEVVLQDTFDAIIDGLGQGDPGQVKEIEPLRLPVHDSNLTVMAPGASLVIDGVLEGRAYTYLSGRYGLIVHGMCGVDDVDHLDDEVQDFFDSLAIVQQ